jgi:hypothetical protein
VEAVFRASGGVPRLINLICDRALYLGYLQRKNVIDPEAVRQSVDELGVGNLTAAPAMEAPNEAVAAGVNAKPESRRHIEATRHDLSGLEVHDIADDPSSPIAVAVAPEPGTPFVPILTLRTNSDRALLDESPSVRKWRNRARRVAVAVGLLIALASVLLMGEVMVMTYSSDVQVLPLPSAPRPPQIAPPPRPVQAPPDALPGEPASGGDTPKPAAFPIVE